MTHDIYKLTAENRDQLRNSMLGSRARATFTFSVELLSGGLSIRTTQRMNSRHHGAHGHSASAYPRYILFDHGIWPSIVASRLYGDW